MLQNTADARDDAATARAGRIDLADLVALLLSLDAPDRDLDVVIEAMLGGDRVVSSLDGNRVRIGFWLRNEVPAYTAGGQALAVLAHRRGFRIESVFVDGFHHVEARSLATGESLSVKATLEGVAGVVSICRMAAKGLS